MFFKKQLFSNIFIILVIIILIIGLWYYQKEKNRQSISSSSFLNTLNPTINTTPNDKSSCKKLGGRWESIGDSPDNSRICNLPTTDGGKLCTDSSQCESFCQAKEGVQTGKQAEGQCYAWKKSITPCFTQITNGITDWPICY